MSTHKKLAIITRGDSDLLGLLKQSEIDCTVYDHQEAERLPWEQYDAFAILGGTEQTPLMLAPKARLGIEEQIRKGKKVFAEYVSSIGHVYFEQPASTRYDRLVFCESEHAIDGIEPGSLLDDQTNSRLRPHDIACVHTVPILQYARIHAHAHTEVNAAFYENISDRALWFDQPQNLLICSFRLCDFIKTRFTPFDLAQRVVQFIVNWLMDKEIALEMQPIYTTGRYDAARPLEEQIEASTHKAMRWFDRAGIVQNEGLGGALEGFGTEVYPGGSQRVSRILRADCTGETALPFFLDYLKTGNQRSLNVSERLLDFVFDHYILRQEGELYGMMRWTDEAWGVCYQDDVARAIIPQLLINLYTNSKEHLQDCEDTLMFLAKTTGTDGTRVMRTDERDLTPERLEQLRTTSGNMRSAHYNAYYHAAMLLCYKLTGRAELYETARKGLESIMEVYPETTREQSETQEYCRLILPLSWLYWITGEETHKEWLYQVTKGLEQFVHPSGAYLEWDSGYTATMRNEVGEGESSLLSQNGDPIVDLLYTNNWLPIAWLQAYWITGDDKFKQLWERTIRFVLNAQLHSEQVHIDGAWARAFDVERNEVFGSPADVGWGPWSIESGWTVAEITAGLYMGLLEEQLRPHYKQ